MKRQLNAWNLVMTLLVMVGASSCSRAEQRGPATPSKAAPAPCFELQSTEVPILWNQQVSVFHGSGSMAEAIEWLRRELRLPISFIEGRPTDRVSAVSAKSEPAHALLRKLLESAPEYQCKVAGGHVIIFRDAATYGVILRGVRITEEKRAAAAHAYVEKLARKVENLSGLEYSVRALGGMVDEVLLDEKVTLARDATVLEHLSQLLGDNPKVYFSIRWGASGSRYFSLGSVL